MTKDVQLYDLPLERFRRYLYFKREAEDILDRASVLEGEEDVKNVILKCRLDIQPKPRLVLCGNPRAIEELKQTLWSPDEVATIEALQHPTNRKESCFEIFLYCTMEAPDKRDAEDLYRIQEKFKDVNVLKQMFLVELGPQSKICENAGHITAEGKDPTCAHCNSFTKFKWALQSPHSNGDGNPNAYVNANFATHDVDKLLNKSTGKESILQEVNTFLETFVLMNLRMVEEKLESILKPQKVKLRNCGFSRPNGVKDMIVNMLSNPYLLEGWKEEPPFLDCKNDAERLKTIVAQFAKAFSKCMHCTFIADLTLNTKLTSFSSALTSRKYEVSSDAKLPVVNTFLQDISSEETLNKLLQDVSSENKDEPLENKRAKAVELQELFKSRLNEAKDKTEQKKSLSACLENIFEAEYGKTLADEYLFAMHQVLWEIHGLFSESSSKDFKDLGNKTVYKELDRSLTTKLEKIPHVVDFEHSFGRLLLDVDIEETQSSSIKDVIEEAMTIWKSEGNTDKLDLIIHPAKRSFDYADGIDQQCQAHSQDHAADMVKARQVSCAMTSKSPAKSQQDSEVKNQPTPRISREGSVNTIHQAGDKVLQVGKLAGSLGGFVRMVSGEDAKEHNICGLVSNHVVQPETNELEVQTKGQNSGITPGVVINLGLPEPSYDIELFTFRDPSSVKFETRLKLSDKTLTNAKLCQFEKQDMKVLLGKKVHIWGAVTAPGYGRVISGQVHKKKELILVERIDKEFSDHGDSGSIVLRDTPDGHVWAVSMLRGKNDKDLYETIKLRDGLESLKRRAEKIGKQITFEFCD